ncbi:MAG: ArsR family transcriptional regulator [Spirochaetes bacterium]|nr:ArsR family transcriptional regulator [Spirochaetota bacterium]
MNTSKFKGEIYQQFSRIGRALASPVRLELLDLLCQAPRTVEALAKETTQSLANTSQHLRVLRQARLVEAEKHGLFVVYSLAGDEVCTFFKSLQKLAEVRLSEVRSLAQSLLAERHMLMPVDRGGLFSRIEHGEVTLLDVRPVDEYRAGHIPGSLSVPLADLAEKIAGLPRDREVVAYCRGPYCVLAIEAVEILRRHGFTALRMEESVHDWQAAGHVLQTEE